MIKLLKKYKEYINKINNLRKNGERVDLYFDVQNFNLHTFTCEDVLNCYYNTIKGTENNMTIKYSQYTLNLPTKLLFLYDLKNTDEFISFLS